MSKLMMVCIALLVGAIATFSLTSPTPTTGQTRKLLEDIIQNTRTPSRIDATTMLTKIELKPNLTLLFTYETTQADTAFATRLGTLTQRTKAQACAGDSPVVTRSGVTYQYQWLSQGRPLLSLTFSARDCKAL